MARLGLSSGGHTQRVCYDSGREAGRIRQGRYAGWDIVVQDDTPDTGGYFILLTSPGGDEAYDDWVPDRATLDSYFQQAERQTDWADR